MPSDRHSTRVFLDYHGFALGWASQAGGAVTDWEGLPRLLTGAAQAALASVDSTPLALTETLFYAAVERRNVGLHFWMTITLGGQPGWRVAVRECAIAPERMNCPYCGDPGLLRPPNKSLTELTTDLVTLAHKDAFDVAILVSDAAELVPAVERVQENGLRIVNAGWRGYGDELRSACWAAFDLDALVEPLSR
jgi:NYN domain